MDIPARLRRIFDIAYGTNNTQAENEGNEGKQAEKKEAPPIPKRRPRPPSPKKRPRPKAEELPAEEPQWRKLTKMSTCVGKEWQHRKRLEMVN